MRTKKPCTFNDISKPDAPPATALEAARRLHASIEESKGEMMSDEMFLENIMRNAVEEPDSFTRERKGEVSGASKKIERHSLKGRTNKVKLVVYMSDVEKEQLDSLVRHRGDRGPSDLVNQVICTALGALRSI